MIRDGALLFLPETPKSQWIWPACRYGQIALAQRLFAAFPNHEEWEHLLVDTASMNGHVAILRFLRETVKVKCEAYALTWAARYGHLDAVQCVHHKFWQPLSSRAMDAAASRGHTHILDFMHRNGVVCSDKAMPSAAANGHESSVQYLCEVAKLPCTEDAVEAAAEYGQLPVLRYLREQAGIECTEYAVAVAARNGHDAVVRYLHEVAHVEFPEYAMDWATQRGHYELAAFIRGVRALQLQPVL